MSDRPNPLGLTVYAPTSDWLRYAGRGLIARAREREPAPLLCAYLETMLERRRLRNSMTGEHFPADDF